MGTLCHGRFARVLHSPCPGYDGLGCRSERLLAVVYPGSYSNPGHPSLLPKVLMEVEVASIAQWNTIF